MIKVEAGGLKGEALLAVVNDDILKFNEFFQQELENPPLHPAEAAILRTYLHYKLVGKNTEP
jgi:hypothetical protein